MITKELFREKILLFTLRFEGGYSNLKDDKGGETYRGISRVHNPTWQGWPIVDKLKPLGQGDIVNHAQLKELITDFYYKNYFANRNLNLITSELVALNIFDFAMHGGFSVEKLQKALNTNFAQRLKADGVLGELTISAINSVPPKMLCRLIIDLRKEYLKEILERNPAQEKFEKGWMNRINALSTMVRG